MNYSDYLKSPHWVAFRQRIYSTRNRCQACGTNKAKLNIHHKNYKCLGKETDDDVLVLCEACHTRFHSRQKWKDKMRKGEELDFVKKADITTNKRYTASDIYRPCKRCGKQHPVFYNRFKNGTLHLYMSCPESRPRSSAIVFEKDLPIPILGRDITKIKRNN